MVPSEVRVKRDELAVTDCHHVNWCNDQSLNDENMPEVSPGGDINPYGWYVVGTTVGGNAVVAGVDDPGIYFADHEWCDDGTPEGVRRELIPLAPSMEDFRRDMAEIELRLDKLA